MATRRIVDSDSQLLKQLHNHTDHSRKQVLSCTRSAQPCLHTQKRTLYVRSYNSISSRQPYKSIRAQSSLLVYNFSNATLQTRLFSQKSLKHVKSASQWDPSQPDQSLQTIIQTLRARNTIQPRDVALVLRYFAYRPWFNGDTGQLQISYDGRITELVQELFAFFARTTPLSPEGKISTYASADIRDEFAAEIPRTVFISLIVNLPHPLSHEVVLWCIRHSFHIAPSISLVYWSLTRSLEANKISSAYEVLKWCNKHDYTIPILALRPLLHRSMQASDRTEFSKLLANSREFLNVSTFTDVSSSISADVHRSCQLVQTMLWETRHTSVTRTTEMSNNTLHSPMPNITLQSTSRSTLDQSLTQLRQAKKWKYRQIQLPELARSVAARASNTRFMDLERTSIRNRPLGELTKPAAPPIQQEGLFSRGVLSSVMLHSHPIEQFPSNYLIFPELQQAVQTLRSVMAYELSFLTSSEPTTQLTVPQDIEYARQCSTEALIYMASIQSSVSTLSEYVEFSSFTASYDVLNELLEANFGSDDRSLFISQRLNALHTWLEQNKERLFQQAHVTTDTHPNTDEFPWKTIAMQTLREHDAVLCSTPSVSMSNVWLISRFARLSNDTDLLSLAQKYAECASDMSEANHPFEEPLAISSELQDRLVNDLKNTFIKWNKQIKHVSDDAIKERHKLFKSQVFKDLLSQQSTLHEPLNIYRIPVLIESTIQNLRSCGAQALFLDVFKKDTELQKKLVEFSNSVEQAAHILARCTKVFALSTSDEFAKSRSLHNSTNWLHSGTHTPALLGNPGVMYAISELIYLLGQISTGLPIGQSCNNVPTRSKSDPLPLYLNLGYNDELFDSDTSTRIPPNFVQTADYIQNTAQIAVLDALRDIGQYSAVIDEAARLEHSLHNNHTMLDTKPSDHEKLLQAWWLPSRDVSQSSEKRTRTPSGWHDLPGASITQLYKAVMHSRISLHEARARAYFQQILYDITRLWLSPTALHTDKTSLTQNDMRQSRSDSTSSNSDKHTMPNLHKIVLPTCTEAITKLLGVLEELRQPIPMRDVLEISINTCLEASDTDSAIAIYFAFQDCFYGRKPQMYGSDVEDAATRFAKSLGRKVASETRTKMDTKQEYSIVSSSKTAKNMATMDENVLDGYTNMEDHIGIDANDAAETTSAVRDHFDTTNNVARDTISENNTSHSNIHTTDQLHKVSSDKTLFQTYLEPVSNQTYALKVTKTVFSVPQAIPSISLQSSLLYASLRACKWIDAYAVFLDMIVSCIRLSAAHFTPSVESKLHSKSNNDSLVDECIIDEMFDSSTYVSVDRLLWGPKVSQTNEIHTSNALEKTVSSSPSDLVNPTLDQLSDEEHPMHYLGEGRDQANGPYSTHFLRRILAAGVGDFLMRRVHETLARSDPKGLEAQERYQTLMQRFVEREGEGAAAVVMNALQLDLRAELSMLHSNNQNDVMPDNYDDTISESDVEDIDHNMDHR